MNRVNEHHFFKKTTDLIFNGNVLRALHRRVSQVK